jgi:ribonuclease HI
MTMEKILPARHFPKWSPDIAISIAAKEQDAIKEDKEASENLRVYSDGSAVDGGVGGAAVLMKDGVMVREKRFYLGKVEEHMVYEAEVVGMILAVHLLKEAGGEGTMALGVDNQAAIRATGSFQSQPGHHLIDTLHDDLRKLLPENDGRKLALRWTPGHKGLAGNEEADAQAKRAARNEMSEGKELPKSLRSRENTPITLPLSKSATKQLFHDQLKSEARTVMSNSPRYEFLRSIDPTFPSNNFENIVDEYPRRHSSLLFQLRSGHVPLNKYLHRISKSPSPRCQQCNEREETVHHFLVSCPKYARQRATLRNEIGPRASQLQHLLSNCNSTKALFTYIASTKRFVQTFGDVTPPNPMETAGE